MMLWGDDTEVKSLENQNKICSALTDAEKNEEVTLMKEHKQEIAEVTQLQVNDVNDVLGKHQQLKGFHKFLKDRRAKNEPMPESSEELMMIYKIERPEFLQNKPNNFKRYAPKVHAQSLYRKHS